MAAVDPGEEVVFELRDARDGTLGPGTAHEELLTLALPRPPADRPARGARRRAGRRAGGRDPRLRDRRLRLDRDLAGLGIPRRPLPGPVPRAMADRGRRGALRAGARRGRAGRRVRRRDRRGPVRRAVRPRPVARAGAVRCRGRGGPARPRVLRPALGRRRPAHLPAARERRQHGRARPGGREPPAAAGARARGDALDRRPALRPGRRGGLHLGDRDGRRGDRQGRDPARGVAAHLPGLGDTRTAGTRLLRHHRHPGDGGRQRGGHGPEPGDAPRADRDARLAAGRARAGATSPPTC